MSMIKLYPGTCQPRIQLDGVVEKRDGLFLVRYGKLFNLFGPKKIVIISIQIFWPLTFGCSSPGLLNEPHSAAETVGDLLCNLGLNSEHIFNGSVPTIRPKMFARICID